MKIKKITKQKNVVYDIEVKHNHNFLLANGILSHNSETRGVVEGSDDLLALSEMPSMKDRENACEQLRKDKRISSAQIAYIATMKPWELIVVERGKKAHRIKRVQPPKTKCWKQDDNNFESAWKKIYNNYRNIKDIKAELSDLNNESNFLIEDNEDLIPNDVGNNDKDDIIIERDEENKENIINYKESIKNENPKEKSLNKEKNNNIKSKRELEIERTIAMMEKYG